MPQSLRIEAKARGWSFLSPDYRLLIPTTAKDIVDDVVKLFEYISTNLPQIDASRIAVGGSSGGGYVARLAAIYAKPAPKALYSLYGSEYRLFSMQRELTQYDAYLKWAAIFFPSSLWTPHYGLLLKRSL